MENSQINKNSKQNSSLFSMNDQKVEKIPNRYILLIYNFCLRGKFPEQLCTARAQLDSTRGTIDGPNGKLGRVYQNKALSNKLEGKHLDVWTGDRIVPMQVSYITDIIFKVGSSRHRGESTPTLDSSQSLLKFLSDCNAENDLLAFCCQADFIRSNFLFLISTQQRWWNFLTLFPRSKLGFEEDWDYGE